LVLPYDDSHRAPQSETLVLPVVLVACDLLTPQPGRRTDFPSNITEPRKHRGEGRATPYGTRGNDFVLIIRRCVSALQKCLLH
jgi:hypothetical protein